MLLILGQIFLISFEKILIVKKLLITFLLIPFITFSQDCNSIYFDGVDDGVILNHPQMFGQNAAISIGREFTVDLWVKTTSTDGTILQKGGHIQSSGNPGYVNIMLDQSGFVVANYGHPTSSGNVQNGYQGPQLYSMFSINDGLWHHISFVRDSVGPSNYDVKLYVDGILSNSDQDNWPHPYVHVSQPTTWTNPLANITTFSMYFPFILGQGYQNNSATSGSPFFNGNLDNVRFWNRDLDASEILNSMNNCNPVNTNGLEFSFNFDEIINGEFEDYLNFYSGEIIDVSLDTISPICCDCEISSNDTTICIGDLATIYTESNYSLLWSNGDTSSTITVNTLADTTINLFFVNSNGSIVCSDSINIYVDSASTPTIQQVANNLLSSNADAYQWYFNGVMLSGETSQLFSILGDGAYTVEITDVNGCTAMSNVFEVVSTNINDFFFDKNILYKSDLFGRQIKKSSFNTIQIIHYDNGEVEKKIVLD